MERHEKDAILVYGKLSKDFPEAAEMLAEEARHEDELISLLEEESLHYAGSIVLGLNDALVELTGTLAGLTFALQSTQLVAVSGLITGIAAALSMSASEYLSTLSEKGSRKQPGKAAISTGIAYLITVTLLILPYLLIHNVFINLAVMLVIAVFIIMAFTFYSAVVTNESFLKRFGTVLSRPLIWSFNVYLNNGKTFAKTISSCYTFFVANASDINGGYMLEQHKIIDRMVAGHNSPKPKQIYKENSMKLSKLCLVVCMLVLVAGLIAGCTAPQTTQAPAEGTTQQPPIKKPAEIVIGVYEPMTGAQAAGGAQTYQGIQLAAEQNKDVLGVPIKVVLVDNRSDKTESATAMTRLIQQEKAIVVIGSYGSSNSMAGGEVSEKAGIPVIGDSPTNPLVTQGKKFYFRVCFIDPFQGRVMAKYAKENGIQKVAIIKNISQDYSVGLSAFFRTSWKELYGSEDGIVAETSYQDGDQDFTAQLGAIKDADAIYAPGYYGDAALLMKQAREMGFKGLFMGSDAWEAPELGKIAGAAAEGAVISSHYSADATASSASKAFVVAFKAKFNETPNTFAALGYDAFSLALDAIKRANSFDPTAIRDAIAATKDYPGVTGSITINETGDAVKDAVVLQVKNGVFTYLTTVKP